MNEQQSTGKLPIKVNRDHFPFNQGYNEKYGKLCLKTNNIIAGRVKQFTFDDLDFSLSLPNLASTTLIDFEQILSESGRVPLDIYCAHALYQQVNEDKAFAIELAARTYMKHFFVILGSTIDYEKNVPSNNSAGFSFLEHTEFGKPKIYYREDGLLNWKNIYLIVFKESFIEKLKANKDSDSEENVLDENTDWKQKYEDLKKLYDELLEKYDLRSQNIVKPSFSTETIELLCKRVCDFNLSTRVINATDAYELNYLFQLICVSKTQLGRIRNIHKKSIKEISDFLEGLGLALDTKLTQEEINFFWKKIEEK